MTNSEKLDLLEKLGHLFLAVNNPDYVRDLTLAEYNEGSRNPVRFDPMTGKALSAKEREYSELLIQSWKVGASVALKPRLEIGYESSPPFSASSVSEESEEYQDCELEAAE